MKKNNPKIYIVFIILSIVCFTLFFIFNEQKTTYELFLLGEKELTLYRNEEYIEPGYIIQDSNGNSINIEIITESNLDITKEGIYEIKYKYNGKVLSERKIKVILEEEKTPSLVLSEIVKELTYGEEKKVLVKTNSDGKLLCTSSNQEIATCELSGKTLIITPMANTSDNLNTKISVNLSKSQKYKEASLEFNVIVNRKVLTCPDSPKSKIYNNKIQLSGITCPKGSMSEGIQKSINAGTYNQICIADIGYKFINNCNVNWSISKADDIISIIPKTYTFDKKGKMTEASAVSGNNVKVTYYSDSLCKVKTTLSNGEMEGGLPKEVGTYYAIGTTLANENYNGGKSACSKAVIINEILPNSISLNKEVVSINKGSTITLIATINPVDANTKEITWASLNSNIATVENGVVMGLSTGATTITATTKNGKTASCSIVVMGNGIDTSYNSSTLKYWIEKKQNNFVVTHVWVKDAYNQMKIAITEPQINGKLIPRKVQKPMTIIQNEINTKNYKNKGLIALNASAIVSHVWNTEAPTSWFGTAAIPIVINDGIIIRDSTKEKLLIGTNSRIYGMNSNGKLVYYTYTDGSTEEKRESNKELFNRIVNDGVKYTFGFGPVLVYNGEIKSTATTPNIRQGICQIDNNNFIILTNSFTSTAQSNRDKGLTFLKMSEYMVSYGCKTGFNLDGGGSVSLLYKKNGTTVPTQYLTAYDGRDLVDMLYFVEK